MSEFPDMNEWNKAVIAEFRANEGKVGGQFEGVPIVLVHHIGAKSGTERVSPLAHFPDSDGSTVIVASKGGAPDNPDWYHNLKANPRVDIEIGTERFPVQASEITGPERDAVWSTVVTTNAGFAEYQKNTDRLIPLIRLAKV